MLTIGTFSLVTGLSVTSLRHYADVGVLVPAEVDVATGYRRYDLAQVPAGRTVALLRRLGVPVDGLRRAVTEGPDEVLREHRDRLESSLDEARTRLSTVDRYLKEGLPVSAVRISQVTVVADDFDTCVAFYRDAFDAVWQPEIGSLQFGRYPDDDFFLLTVAHPDTHPWAGGPVKFGLTVPDVDAAHARALAAGGTEVAPAVDRPWKPRSSTVADPSGNHVDLYAGR